MYRFGYFLFLIFILVKIIACDNLEPESMESFEVSTKKVPSSKSFSFFNAPDDAVFNFINKLVNTAHLTSKMAVNRAKTENERRKHFEEEIDEYLSSIGFSAKIANLDESEPIVEIEKH